MYAITGASGQLGRLVIEALLKTVAADQIIAVVRHRDKASDLEERGVITRVADYNRADTLVTAFDGVKKLLLISSNEVMGRLAQHRAVIEAAGKADVSLVAYTSMLHADTSAAKLAIEHLQTEAAIAGSKLPAVILRNGWYTENHLMSLPNALKHGAFVGAAGLGRFSSAGRRDYAEAAAVVLTSEGHEGNIYELAGDTSYTLGELAAEVSRQSNNTVVYNNLTEADYAALLKSVGLPADLAAILADADVAASNGALMEDGEVLGKLLGRPTVPMETMVSEALQKQV